MEKYIANKGFEYGNDYYVQAGETLLKIRDKSVQGTLHYTLFVHERFGRTLEIQDRRIEEYLDKC